jgi:hypothetical protein
LSNYLDKKKYAIDLLIFSSKKGFAIRKTGFISKKMKKSPFSEKKVLHKKKTGIAN